jgi:hypothetical protein
MAQDSPKGLIEQGNLQIWNRPAVQNSDGTHSSEYSTSFQDKDGREILVPTVVNGYFLSHDGKKPREGSQEEKAMFNAAWIHYQKTGENLGKFDNAENADVYAGVLHNRGSVDATAKAQEPPAKPDGSNADQLAQQAHIAYVGSSRNVNPLMAKDPLDRQAGVYAKGLRLINLRRFQQLDSENQTHVLGQYYDTYVAPAYTSSHAAPPDRDTWIREFSKSGGPSMRVSDFYLNKGPQADALSDAQASFLNMGAMAVKTAANIANGAIMAGMKVDQKLFGLKGYFPAPQNDSWRDKFLAKDNQIFGDRYVKGFMRMNQGLIDNANFWFDSRPSRTLSERAGSFVGEQAVQLPMYKAIGVTIKGGAALLGANKALNVLAASGESGAIVKAANLTRRLAASPLGRFVGRRLGDAADAYIGGVIQQENSTDRKRDVLYFTMFASALEVPGGVLKGVRYINDKRAMKAAISEEALMGGLPLVDANVTQAAHELNNRIIGYDHNGDPIKVSPNDSVETLKQALSTTHDADPIKTKLVMAAKVRLNAITKEMFGDDKRFEDLDIHQQSKVLQEHGKTTAEAVEELPIHQKEAAQAEIGEQIKKDIEESPKLGQTYNELQQLADQIGKETGQKIDVVGTIHAGEVNAIKDENGLRSVQGATEKSIDATKKANNKERARLKKEDPDLYREVSSNVKALRKGSKKAAVVKTTKESMAEDSASLRKLLADVSKEEIKDFETTMGSFKENFPEAYNNGLSNLVKMQAARAKLKTLEGATKRTRHIQALIKSGSTFTSREAIGLR